MSVTRSRSNDGSRTSGWSNHSGGAPRGPNDGRGTSDGPDDRGRRSHWSGKGQSRHQTAQNHGSVVSPAEGATFALGGGGDDCQGGDEDNLRI